MTDLEIELLISRSKDTRLISVRSASLCIFVLHEAILIFFHVKKLSIQVNLHTSFDMNHLRQNSMLPTELFMSNEETEYQLEVTCQNNELTHPFN